MVLAGNFRKIENMTPVKNKLRVLHFPQVPCEPFFVDVKNEYEASLIGSILADQHCFLYDNNFIPDYSNIVSVVMWEDDIDGEGTAGWSDYYNDVEGMEFDEFEETYLK